ncbi:MAG: MucR family transcriptional regulator [Pseudomonadota bacterium]
MTQQDTKNEMIAQIVSAYAARPDVSAADIAELTLKLTHGIGSDAAPSAAPEETVAPLAFEAAKPAIPVEKAVTNSKVYCLCCGKGFKMLKRHLGAEHGLTEAQYRAKFNLPEDFPLVAPEYSAMKAKTAKKLGLGRYERTKADPVE